MKSKFLNKLLLVASAIVLTTTFSAKTSSAQTFETNITEDPLVQQLYMASSNNDVTVKSYSKDILQDDSYLLTLDNVSSDVSVSFFSSDTDVFTVKKISDSVCRYTGVGYGEATLTIKVTVNNGFFFFLDERYTIKKKISVTPHATSVKFKMLTKTIGLEQKSKLAIILRPSISEEVPTYTVKNKNIATVKPNGYVIGKKEGFTYITAEIENGKTAKCKIIVKKDYDEELLDEIL